MHMRFLPLGVRINFLFTVFALIIRVNARRGYEEADAVGGRLTGAISTPKSLKTKMKKKKNRKLFYRLYRTMFDSIVLIVWPVWRI